MSEEVTEVSSPKEVRVPAEPKKAWKSRSVWVGIIVAIAPFIPFLGDKINESVAMSIVGVIMVGLRLITKSEIKLH